MTSASNLPLSGTPEALTQHIDGKELKVSVFGYATPLDLTKPKGIVPLCRSDIVYSTVQVLKSGGENNLHAHPAQDGIWIVLKGRAKFYGQNDALLADLGPLQGVHIPRGFYYWFESSSPELLELLQVEAIDKSVANKRLDATQRKDFATHVQEFEPAR